MKKILSLVSILLLSILLVSCQDSVNEDALKVEYDELIIEGQVGKIKVESIYEDDIISIESLDTDIIEIIENNGDDMIAKAINDGVANIKITNKYGNVVTIEIFVDKDNTPFVPVENIEMSLVEEGPYYVLETYHLKLDVTPQNSNDEYHFYDSTLYEINLDTLEITFKQAGTHKINLSAKKSHKQFSLTVEVDIDYSRDDVYYILFIGNSLTYVHDIPSIIKSMINADGGYVSYIQDTPGGSTLESHYDKFKEITSQYKFSHIVLQGQSKEPISNKQVFLNAMQLLASEVEGSNAELIVYETWCYDGEQYRYSMTEGLQASYEEAADLIGARITRSGEAFRLFEETYGFEISLYQDLNHQSEYGAFLSACVHYSTFTGKRASDNSFIMEGISEEWAVKIKGIADKISFGE